MLDRLEPALRITCIVLAGLLLFQVSRLAPKMRKLPLSNLNLPTAAAAPVSSDTNHTVQSGTTNTPPGRPAPAAVTSLPPPINARVERVKESEIFGPVPRPLPMALLGIAGKDAFFRAPNGQTGLVREGGELGGVKMLQIGTNRVLVEENGQKKELTIFSGMGSATLLSTGKEQRQ